MTNCWEHIVEIFPRDMDRLRRWLERRPNGALVLGRVTLESVEHGGIFVRTYSRNT